MLVGLSLPEPRTVAVAAERLEALEADRVSVRLPEPPGQDTIDHWRGGGPEVHFGHRSPASPRAWLWPALVPVLLGIGLWRLVRQGYCLRASEAPRQRPREAELGVCAGQAEQRRGDDLTPILGYEL